MSAAAYRDEHAFTVPVIMAVVVAAHTMCDVAHWKDLPVDESSMRASPQRRHALALHANPFYTVLQWCTIPSPTQMKPTGTCTSQPCCCCTPAALAPLAP